MMIVTSSSTKARNDEENDFANKSKCSLSISMNPGKSVATEESIGKI